MSTQGPRVSKSVTKKITSTATYTFSHAELCKRLRLPIDAKLVLVSLNGGTRLPLDGDDLITAEVTTEATK